VDEEPVEGHEGATRRLSPRCPQCHGAMEEGYLLDHSHGTQTAGEWVAGPPERSIWTGVKTRGRLRYRVSAYRCEQCGFLASYAITPVGGGQ